MKKALERAGARWWRGHALLRGVRLWRRLPDRADARHGRGARGPPLACRSRASTPRSRPARSAPDGQELVVVEVRFLSATVAALDAPARDVRVSALGSLSVTVGGRTRDGDWLQQRPGQVFRYLLASRASAQRSEAIASALWPDRGPSAVANVRYCIFKLREQLADSGDPAGSLVVRDAAGYRIDLRRVELDVDRFQERTNAGIAAQRRGESSVAEPMLWRGDRALPRRLPRRRSVRRLGVQRARVPASRWRARISRRWRRSDSPAGRLVSAARAPAEARPARAVRLARAPDADRGLPAPRPPHRGRSATTTRCGRACTARSASSPTST